MNNEKTVPLNYTAREILEIKGSFFYLIMVTFICIISTVFQILAKINFKNVIVTISFSIICLTISYFIYTRLKNRKNADVLKWIVGMLSIIVTIISKFNYAKTMDWTYAAQAYHLSAMAVAFIIILQFLYNRNLLITASVTFFAAWTAFLILADANGVVFYPHSIIDGKIIHDGIQIHREIYFFIILVIITAASYRNIPIINDYDSKNARQAALILKQYEKHSALSAEIKNMTGDLFVQMEKQGKIVEDFNGRMQGEAAILEELSATTEELFATSENISLSAVNQLDENNKTEQTVKLFKKIQESTKANLDLTMNAINSLVQKTNIGNESLRSVENTIEGINDQGRRISETVAIIVDIADRINLLSLNASIEAARAGEFGRGFAVVADEIGKLAVQTSDGIKEIEKVLSISAETTTSGVRVIKTAADTVKMMITDINESSLRLAALRESILMEEQHTETIVSQVVKNISLAKNIDTGAIEQKSAIEGVNRAIENLNSDMTEMVSGIQIIYESVRQINQDTKSILDKTSEEDHD